MPSVYLLDFGDCFRKTTYLCSAKIKCLSMGSKANPKLCPRVVQAKVGGRHLLVMRGI
jgi:hypothetical protein